MVDLLSQSSTGNFRELMQLTQRISGAILSNKRPILIGAAVGSTSLADESSAIDEPGSLQFRPFQFRLQTGGRWASIRCMAR